MSATMEDSYSQPESMYSDRSKKDAKLGGAVFSISSIFPLLWSVNSRLEGVAPPSEVSLSLAMSGRIDTEEILKILGKGVVRQFPFSAWLPCLCLPKEALEKLDCYWSLSSPSSVCRIDSRAGPDRWLMVTEACVSCHVVLVRVMSPWSTAVACRQFLHSPPMSYGQIRRDKLTQELDQCCAVGPAGLL